MCGGLLRKKACKLDRLVVAVPVLALALSGAGAPASAATVQLDAGAAYEDYSFAVPGRTQWAEVLVRPAPRWGLIGAQNLVRRFDITQGQGSVGGVAKLSAASALELRLSFSPEAVLLPALAGRGLWYRGLGRGFTLNPGYSYSRYEVAHVHTLTLGLDWERGDVLATGRVYGTATRFRSGAPTRQTPGFLAQARVPLSPRVRLLPSYSYREESFQAGAPGAFASAVFKAHALGLAALLDLGRGISLRLGWQYEGRIPSAYVRQYELGLSYKP